MPARGSVLGAATEDIDAKLAELQRQIADIKNNPQTVFVPTFTGPPATTPISTATFAPSQRIDRLSGTEISNPTITGGSITAASIVGTIGNAISSAFATIDTLTSNTITATNVTFTNATTTTLYASSIAATAASTTNATTTNLATANLRVSSLDCTSFGNGGTLTTDASGNVVCATDDGGAGGTVAGSDMQVQFNSGGGFAASASFTFSSTTGRLAAPYASTTAFTALGTGYFGTASTTNLTISGLPATLLSTDISGAAQSTTVSSPLSFSGSILSIAQASSTASGYLSALDWNAFNTKFATTSSDYWITQYGKGFFFSTTSADAWEASQWRWGTSSSNYFESTLWRWATSSANYWETMQTRWATTSSAYFLSQNQGAAFSTSSASYFLLQNQSIAFGTSSSDYWLSQYGKGFFFSTTSASYWDSAQWRWSTSSATGFEATQWRWATTSTAYWETTQWRWATTSSNYWLTQNQGVAFSTTSANYLLNASTTIPRTSLANVWSPLQTFATGLIAQASSTFTGGLLSLNGGASTTALTVTGNSYFPGSGIWNSVGNVGIGTSSPFTTLSVQGSGFFSGTLTAAKLYGNISSTTVLATGATTARKFEDMAADVVNVKDFGATGDGITVDSAAITAALATASATRTTLYFPDGTYIVDQSFTIPDSIALVKLSHGATIKQTANVPIFTKSGSYSGALAATAPVPIGSVALTMPDTTGLSVGDWVFIKSNDQNPLVTAGLQVGMLRKITALGAQMHIDAATYRSMTTSIHVRKVTLCTRTNFEGGTYTASDPAAHTDPLLYFHLCNAPNFRSINIANSGGAGIVIDWSVGGSFQDSNISNLLDDPGNGNYGYGINLSGATRGFAVISGNVGEVRHAITTTTGYPDGSQTDTRGEPEDISIGSGFYVYNTTNAAIDTHEAGFSIYITPNIHGAFDGVLIRASDVFVTGGQIVGARRNGIKVSGPASNPAATSTLVARIKDTVISNVGDDGSGSTGIAVQYPGQKVYIDNVSIRGYGTAGISTVANSQVFITGGIVDGLTASAQTGVDLNSSGNRIDGLTVANNYIGIDEASGVINNEWNRIIYDSNVTNLSRISTYLLSSSMHYLPFISQTASEQALIVRATSTQAANVFEVQNGTGYANFVVDKSGNIGIGTSTPNNKLDIYSAGNASLGFNTNSGLSTWTMGLDMNDGGKFKISSSTALGTNDRFVIDDSGNVGIGTGSPQANLDISSATSTLRLTNTQNKNWTIGDVQGALEFYISDASGGGAYPGVGARVAAVTEGTTGVNTALSFSVQRSGVPLFEAMRISPTNGKVGIGTSTPWAKLSIKGSGTGTGIGFAFSDSNDSPKVVIQDNGNVGIGTTTPQQILHVARGADSSLEIARFENASTGSSAESYITVGTVNSNKGGYLGYNFTNGYTFLGEHGNNPALTLNGSNVGIGTTTPYSRLTVWGTGTGSTTAFAVVNNSSTTAFAVYDNGNATYAGSIFQSSDQRLKTDIQTLDASSSLFAIEQLNPVSYSRLDQPSQGQQLGFIAQNVQHAFPQLVSTSSPTALTPDGTLTVNYPGLIAPIVKAIQALVSRINEMANTVASFAEKFVTKDLVATNITTDRIQFHIASGQTICLGATCITESQLAAILAAIGQSTILSAQESTGTSATSSSTPPTIEIQGNNPAHIQVGVSYNDLGAIITGPTDDDRNLGIHLYLDGVAVSSIMLDTSASSTHAIDYVATNSAGTSTSTRSVFVEGRLYDAEPQATSTAQIGGENASSTSSTL